MTTESMTIGLLLAALLIATCCTGSSSAAGIAQATRCNRQWTQSPITTAVRVFPEAGHGIGTEVASLTSIAGSRRGLELARVTAAGEAKGQGGKVKRLWTALAIAVVIGAALFLLAAADAGASRMLGAAFWM